MKLTPMRIVIGLNFLALAFAYGWAFTQPAGGSSPANIVGVMGLIASIVLIPTNAVLFVLSLIVFNIILSKQQKKVGFNGSWAQAFLFGLGLIILFNTPLCFALSYIQSLLPTA